MRVGVLVGVPLGIRPRWPCGGVHACMFFPELRCTRAQASGLACCSSNGAHCQAASAHQASATLVPGPPPPLVPEPEVTASGGESLSPSLDGGPVRSGGRPSRACSPDEAATHTPSRLLFGRCCGIEGGRAAPRLPVVGLTISSVSPTVCLTLAV